MNPDDKSLFLDAMEDVKPLKNANVAPCLKPKAPRLVPRVDTLQLDNPLTTGFLDLIPRDEPLEFRR
ncbi:DNA endonuclease SmrA, partial [Cronobacter sakazakii]|nr:DNA endonuclease SmrA [Cronobacter sakazakii]